MPPKGLPRGLSYGGDAKGATCATKLLRVRALT